MKLKNVIHLSFFAVALMLIAPSCIKEGPMGPRRTRRDSRDQRHKWERRQ